jgi:hypothetical protein
VITAKQQDYIRRRAYVPDHLPAYVAAVSPVEPFFIEDFVIYAGQNRLIIVGYPLSGTFEEARLEQVLTKTTERFDPELISVTAPIIPPSLVNCSPSPADSYYRLELADLSIPQKVRNMLNRAGREVEVVKSREFREEHHRLVKAFLQAHTLDEGTQFIFNKISQYIKTETAWLFEARNQSGDLVAFDVAEFGPENYAFYMFNFCARQLYVPGASDLLLSKIIEQAIVEEKRYLNLGLGINAGVTFFKTKWGGVPFLPHYTCRQERARTTSLWQNLFDSLLS